MNVKLSYAEDVNGIKRCRVYMASQVHSENCRIDGRGGKEERASAEA